MDIRDRIRERLEALGISARAASLKAGLSTHYLQKLLADPDKSITTDNLFKLAEALEVTPEWLLTGKGDPEPRPSAEVVDIWDRILDQKERDAWMNMGKALAAKEGED